MSDLPEEAAAFESPLRNPPSLPEEAVQAAADALNNAHGQHEYAGACPVCCGDDETVIRIALEAAAPVLAAQERADERRKVAEELRAEGEKERVRLVGENGHTMSRGDAIHNAITGWEMAAHFVEGGPKGTVTIINQLPERTENA